ncbi:unnamed protein product (macronuclear) [Paramecium tetraurelia]|uniref:Uncharacterized protein n=1 Tax=Paramecium tetraurelia TaxID=5888 RepID=A0BFH3_PARTE|nr:uncharacterized protein GSPATT00028325001 [Paramecium tetraurelia]CAK57290.1 unnamed protein product [Paramecium tetraurelia]|eukprot:XP_001424688.1 hypothetical protein (macronuclear) [Paramecium tetraurelia strain d4-2]
MIPVQVLKTIQNQNIQLHQTNPAFLKSRKHSPINHLIVTRHPRVSHQIKEQSNSLQKHLKTSSQYNKCIQSVEQFQRLPTEANGETKNRPAIQISSALKMSSSKHPSEQYYDTLKFSSFVNEKVNDQFVYTNIGEAKENEKEFSQAKIVNGSVDTFIVHKTVLNWKNLEIQKLEKELEQLKQENRKYQNLEIDYQTLLQENSKLKLVVQTQQIEINCLNHQQTFTQLGKSSDYVSALSDSDKLKLQSLIECD